MNCVLLVADALGGEAIVSRGLQEFLHGPDVICQSRLHRGGDAKGLMNTNEVVKSHIERDSSFQVVQLLAERIGKPRKTAKVHSHAQVGAFDVTGRDAFNLRTAAYLDWYSVQNLCRRVLVRPFGFSSAVNLDELRVVHFRSEAILDGGNVGLETVRRDLEAASDSLTQIAGQNECALGIPFADMVGQDHFGFTIESNPGIGVSPLFGIVRAKMPVFRVNVGPKFVSLDKSRPDVSNARIENTSAFVTDRNKKRKNRVLVNASDARDCADTHSLSKKSDYLAGFFGGNVVPSEWMLAGLRECSLAGLAAKSLNPQSTIGSEPLCYSMQASNARHFRPCLSYEASRKCYLRSALRLTPRADLALPSVRADGRAFVSLLLWSKLYWQQWFKGGSCGQFGQFVLADPTVRQSFVIGSNFLIIQHPFQRRVNACHDVSVLTKVQLPILQLVSNFNWTEAGRVVGLQNLSDSLCHATAAEVVDIPNTLVQLLFREWGNREDRQLQLSNFLLNVFLLFKKVAQALTHLLDHLFVVVACHSGEII